jgi:hypothetical protein
VYTNSTTQPFTLISSATAAVFSHHPDLHAIGKLVDFANDKRKMHAFLSPIFCFEWRFL